MFAEHFVDTAYNYVCDTRDPGWKIDILATDGFQSYLSLQHKSNKDRCLLARARVHRLEKFKPILRRYYMKAEAHVLT